MLHKLCQQEKQARRDRFKQRVMHLETFTVIRSYHFIQPKIWIMHMKVETDMRCMYQYHCLLANCFFNPLRILPNHIKFIVAKTDGTTKTKKYPKICIWITCQATIHKYLNFKWSNQMVYFVCRYANLQL